MTKKILWTGFTALGLIFVGSAVAAGPIGAACMQSHRSAASSALCSCIQQVADVTLPGADQRRAAAFFRDPDKAQQVRMSKSRNDDAFWARYTAFGQKAEAYCAG
ncbi:MAG: hypothetical protein ABI832_03415 [bacterium]